MLLLLIFLGLRSLAVARGGLSHNPAQLAPLQHWTPPVASQQVFIINASSVHYQHIVNASSMHHQWLISTSSVHHHCIISASSVYHQCIISASSTHHQSIISAPSVHHQCIISAPSLGLTCQVHHFFFKKFKIFSSVIQLLWRNGLSAGGVTA